MGGGQLADQKKGLSCPCFKQKFQLYQKAREVIHSMNINCSFWLVQPPLKAYSLKGGGDLKGNLIIDEDNSGELQIPLTAPDNSLGNTVP